MGGALCSTHMRITPLAVLAGVLLSVPWGGREPAMAAVLVVTDCGDTTPGGAPGQLRRLITDAAAGDTIVVPACTITLTGTPGTPEFANADGSLDVDKNLTVQGAGSGATIIDAGTTLDRVLVVLAGATVTVTHLTIQRGIVPAGAGGGILNEGSLALDRVRVLDNAAFRGGGIANHGSLTILESTVAGNTVTQVGGIAGDVAGIYNSGFVQLTRSTVSLNIAFGFRSAIGGIGNDTAGTLILVDSTVSGNNGGSGFMTGPPPGGISNSGYMIVIGSAIVANSGPGVGSGGVALFFTTIVANNVAATQCQIAGTFVSMGGNLATDASCGSGAPGDDVVADAGLGPLGQHGGPTETHPLLPGSPAIDTAPSCGPIDQRLRPRPNNLCDKGPYEFYAPIFADVPADHFAREAIEELFLLGITSGCGITPLVFCPDDFVTREQIAVLLLRAMEGSDFTPPPATGLFIDVPVNDPFAPWIEELFNRGVTAGCETTPARFCPDDALVRAQLAVLFLRALEGPAFVPPPPTGFISDVPVDGPFAPWIEEFVRRGLSAGCQAVPLAYCPDEGTTRAEVALFLLRAFGFDQ
jgi:hypothetical protein